MNSVFCISIYTISFVFSFYPLTLASCATGQKRIVDERKFCFLIFFLINLLLFNGCVVVVSVPHRHLFLNDRIIYSFFDLG